MKNIFTALFAMCAITTGSISANAMSGDSSLRALLGFTSGSVNMGMDFEMKQSNLYGIGGYLFMADDQEGTNKVTTYKVMALGAFAPIHLLNDAMIDVYVAPGFGIVSIEHPSNTNQDDTSVGPTLKIGAEYKVAQSVKLGLQYFIVQNWLSDEVPDQAGYMSAAATFLF